MLNRQLVFTDATAALLAQGIKALDNTRGSCCYRHPRDPHIRCAIGHLIPDDLYDPEIEDLAANHEDVLACLDPKYGTPDRNTDDRNFLINIQNIHDNYAPHIWPIKFACLAHQYDLESPV